MFSRMYKGNFPAVVSNKTETYWDSIALGHITFNLIRSYHWKNVRRIFCLHGRLNSMGVVWIFALRNGSESGLRTPGTKKLRNRGDFCLWPYEESLALESGKQLKESGIPLTIGIRSPSSIHKVPNPVPGILNLPREIRNPILSWIKYLYGFPYICRELK